MKKKRRERNPVAKYCNVFNKASTHRDKKKEEKKGKTKHKARYFLYWISSKN